MHRRSYVDIWAVVLLVVALACDTIPNEPLGESERLGIVKYREAPVIITVPEFAKVGEPITISVMTFGAEPCVTKGRTRIQQVGYTVTVEPIDSLPELPPGTVCSAALEHWSHEVSHTFLEPGIVTVRVRGREWLTNELYTEKHTVRVH